MNSGPHSFCIFITLLFFSPCPEPDVCVRQAQLPSDPDSAGLLAAGASAAGGSSGWQQRASCHHLSGALALPSGIQQRSVTDTIQSE